MSLPNTEISYYNDDVIFGDNVHLGLFTAVGSNGFSFSKETPRKLNKSDYKVIVGNNVYIDTHCVIHKGTFKDTVIGHNTIIDSHVHISHDCTIGDNCEIDTGATILGEVTIGDNSRICSRATIHPKVRIGKNCVVGANSYLRHDLKDGEIAYGNPAKVIRNTKYRKTHALH